MVRMTLAAVIAFACFVVVHFLHFHFLPPQEKTKAVLWVALVGLGLFAVLMAILPSEESLRVNLRLSGTIADRVLPVIVGALVYGLLFLGYLEFYFTADRSITFRMLIITSEQPDKSITTDEMLAHYDTPQIIRRRMNDLAYGGYYEVSGDRYRLTTKGQFAAGVYRFTIKFLKLGKY